MASCLKRLVMLSIALAVLAVQSFADEPSYLCNDDSWSRFKTTYSKSYDTTDEETEARKNFCVTTVRVAVHNFRFAKKQKTYEMEINKFSDIDSSGDSTGLGLFGFNPKKANGRIDGQMSPNEIPDSIDWRAKGMVSPVKDQKTCGSCWAFATVGCLESYVAIRSGQTINASRPLIDLSEKELVDCASSHGCDGGTMSDALDYVKAKGGLWTEGSHPYQPTENVCPSKPNAQRYAKINSYMEIGTASHLLHTVAKEGPVVSGLYASANFLSYKRGVFSDPLCNGITTANHAILVVGYGTDNETGEYWIIKNSWGTNWGENGFIRFKRGGNYCNIEKYGFYPSLTSEEQSTISPGPITNVSLNPVPSTLKTNWDSEGVDSNHSWTSNGTFYLDGHRISSLTTKVSRMKLRHTTSRSSCFVSEFCFVTLLLFCVFCHASVTFFLSECFIV